MSEWCLALASALWLGILTSISPCPLATNIAAISFISRKVNKPGYVFYTGILYTLGRATAYILLGVFIVKGLMSMPVISHWLQKYVHKLLGPILILVGMILLDLLSFGGQGSNLGQWIQGRSEKIGLAGALLLGIVFAA